MTHDKIGWYFKLSRTALTLAERGCQGQAYNAQYVMTMMKAKAAAAAASLNDGGSDDNNDRSNVQTQQQQEG